MSAINVVGRKKLQDGAPGRDRLRIRLKWRMCRKVYRNTTESVWSQAMPGRNVRLMVRCAALAIVIVYRCAKSMPVRLVPVPVGDPEAHRLPGDIVPCGFSRERAGTCHEKSPQAKRPAGFSWGGAARAAARGPGNYMPMPPMPPIPPMSGMPPPAPASSFGASATMHSVVSSSDATEAAFCRAVRVTFVGSRMPSSSMSP